MDIIQLYRDYNVEYVTEGHKHTRENWVQTKCPFCTGNPGYHLGYDTLDNKYVCWRCGGKWTPKVISHLLNVSIQEAFSILSKYKGLVSSDTKKTNKKVKVKAFHFPTNTTILMPNHIRYLEARNYNIEYLKKYFFLKGTGVFSKLGKIDYRYRIIIPYVWESKIVSFDGRDITGKAMNKYMACPEDRELIGRKQILYANEKCFSKDSAICVEGPTDVWRLGVNSFAVSGIKYTPSQVRLITRMFKRVFIWFDEESQAQEQAIKLAGDLRFRGIECIIIHKEGDPGDLEQSEADYIVNQLIK